MGGRQSMPTPALLAHPGGWALVSCGGWPVCWKVNPGTCKGWMLFCQQKCCSQRLVHCNSSSSGPPPLPGVLGLSRGMCRSPMGVPNTECPMNMLASVLAWGRGWGQKKCPWTLTSQPVPSAVPCWVQACEQKPRELEGIKGLPAAVRRMGYCTAGREETVTQKERDGGGLWH